MENPSHDHNRITGFAGLLFAFSLAITFGVSSGMEERIDQLERSVTELREQVDGLRRQIPVKAAVPDPVPSLVNHIARMEGYHVPGSLPRRQHNPGSLVYAGQPGTVRGAGGYARFPSPAAGFAALERDLRAKLARSFPLSRAWPYLPPAKVRP